jgi:hypothetical protein
MVQSPILPRGVKLTVTFTVDSDEEKNQQAVYWDEICPTIEDLVSAVLTQRPAAAIEFMKGWLTNSGMAPYSKKDAPNPILDDMSAVALNLFQQADRNASGCIDTSELRSVMARIGLNDKHINEVFKSIDKDKDSKISYMEFLSWLGLAPDCPPSDVNTTSVERIRSKLLNHINKSAQAGVTFFNFLNLSDAEDGVCNNKSSCDAAPFPTSGPAPSWRAATWNAAAEVTKFEFLPQLGAFPSAVEQLAGAVVLRLRGVHTWYNEQNNWLRYAPGEPSVPAENELAPLLQLRTDDILDGFDVKRLMRRWARWLVCRPGDDCEAEVIAHMQSWRKERLADLFKYAMAVFEDDIDPSSKIPGFAQCDRSIISGPDLQFSQRTYHIRGSRWTEFLQDAVDSSFTMAMFWEKWIDGLSDTYKKDPETPIEFLPSQAEFDYLAIALWDGFLFRTARRAAELGGAPEDAESWEELRFTIELPLEELLQSAQGIVDWSIGPAKVDVLFLQESGQLSPPLGWRAYPEAGAPTSVWVAESSVDHALTSKAQAALVTMKTCLLKAHQAFNIIEEKIFEASLEGMLTTATAEIASLGLQEQVHMTLEHMVLTFTSEMQKDWSEKNKSSLTTGQLKRVEKWFEQDKIAVAVIRLAGNKGDPILVISGHAESGGTTTGAVLALAKALHGELQSFMNEGLRAIVGMDSNVKASNTGSACNPETLKRTAKVLGFRHCNAEDCVFAGTNEIVNHTVSKTRGFLQTQMKGKAGVPDENIKDWIFYLPAIGPDGSEQGAPAIHGQAINQVSADSAEAGYCKGGMPRGVDFPSDHALVLATAS